MQLTKYSTSRIDKVHKNNKKVRKNRAIQNKTVIASQKQSKAALIKQKVHKVKIMFTYKRDKLRERMFIADCNQHICQINIDNVA